MDFLVVVDAQNDFIDGALGSPQAVKVLPKICEKIRNWEGDHIVLTLDSHTEDYANTLEGMYLPVEHCIMGKDGWLLHGDVVEELKNKTFTTVAKSTFGSKYLPGQIANYAIVSYVGEIELIGYVLDICVISNALLLKAYFPNSIISVDVSCCAATSQEAFEAAKVILRSCQIIVKE